jgi:hypothetical protein
LVKHSRDKDQFLKVAIKCITETQILKDELKEVRERNSILLTKKQELETKLAKEGKDKDDEHPIDPFIFVFTSCPSELWTDHYPILQSIRSSPWLLALFPVS